MLLRRLSQQMVGEELGEAGIPTSPSPLKPLPLRESPARSAHIQNPLFFLAATENEATSSPGSGAQGELPAGYIDHAARAFETAVSPLMPALPTHV